MEAVSSSKLHLCDVMICPEFEKARSDGAEVMGIAKYFLEDSKKSKIHKLPLLKHTFFTINISNIVKYRKVS